jgi:hypothetical protein
MGYNNKWTYSLDEENFSNCDYFDTKEEAIEAGKEYAIDCEENYIYIGKCKEYIPWIDVERIIEQVGDTAYDNLGEAAEDYLCDVSKDAEKELEKKITEVFFEWLNKYNLNPNFYSVVNIQKINITE